MTKQLFNLPHDKRTAFITIDDYISFSFKDAQEFYWLEKEQWANADRNDESDFYHHLKRKSWFTPEMEQFLDKEIKPNVSKTDTVY